MSDKSKIEWTDATWQVSGGCDRVSSGCEQCYAERLVGTRQRHLDSRRDLTVIRGDGKPHWTGMIALYPDNLDQPLRWSRPRRIFVNSLSDLFHKDVPFEFIAACFGVMAAAPLHTFQVLTKRPQRMLEWSDWISTHGGLYRYIRNNWSNLRSFYASGSRFGTYRGVRHRTARDCGAMVLNAAGCSSWPLPNVWLGVSAEDQTTADERIPLLLKTSAAVRFVSAEPLLGPVDFTPYVLGMYPCANCGSYDWLPWSQGGPECKKCGGTASADRFDKVDWVIAGGESGPASRPCKESWLREVLEACLSAKTPVFIKQMGSEAWDDCTWEGASPSYQFKDRKGGDWSEWPEDLRVRQFPEVKR